MLPYKLPLIDRHRSLMKVI